MRFKGYVKVLFLRVFNSDRRIIKEDFNEVINKGLSPI